MSGKGFFKNRYSRLGWVLKTPILKQAIRVNKTVAKNQDFLWRMGKAGVTLAKIPFLDNGYWVEKSRVSVGATAEYLLGKYSIQEAAAQIPATLFSEIRDKLVLDACSAPGGKTVQLADLMDNTGAIIALDVNEKRIAALTNHLERCHIRNAVVYKRDARTVSALKLRFNRILLDVPCSGNFASDNDWFERRTLVDIKRNAALQRAILAEATACLDEGGEIVYSTCSLEPEENELNMDWAIKNLPLEIDSIDCIGEEGLTSVFDERLDASITKCRRLWPDETQGFFVCKLKVRQTQK